MWDQGTSCALGASHNGGLCHPTLDKRDTEGNQQHHLKHFTKIYLQSRNQGGPNKDTIYSSLCSVR